jgi:hypothetical protein
MPSFKLLGAAAILFAASAPAMAQQAMSEPAYCAQFYPYANCQNKGPGNPYTDPNYPRGPAPNATTWRGDQTVGVAGRRSRTHRSDSSATRAR